MSERDLTPIFHECVEMLAAGNTVEDCLRRYPQYASQLRPMLETGLLVRRVMVNPLTVQQAQDRVRFKVAQAAAQPAPRGGPRSLLSLVAGFILVFLISTGLLVGSTDSLPGDALYPLKRAAENAQLGLSSDASLRDQFAQRRIDETAALLASRREAEVRFTGQIEQIDDTIWQIASLPVQIPSLVASTEAFNVGDTVEVRGLTTSQGQLIAAEIRLIEDLPTVVTPTLSVPTTAPIMPTVTPTVTATHTPSATTTWTPTTTGSPTATHTPTRIPPTSTPRPTDPPVIVPTQAPTQQIIPPTDDHGGDDSSDDNDGSDNSGSGSDNSGSGSSDDSGGGGSDDGGDDDS
jgi:uncharacterized membrane protein YgcG